MLELNKIYQGDSLEVLKTFPDNSINCVMTSPPYWALRDYGTAKWEGGDVECKHDIKNNIKNVEVDWDRPSRIEFNKVGELLKCQVCDILFKGKLRQKFCSTKCLNTLSNEERNRFKSEKIDSCYKCGAKLVDKQLGLEPTFQEYINQLCNIFDEVKRVLKNDGTCWVNLGDTYISKGENRHEGYNDPKYNNGRIGRKSEPNGMPQIIPEKCLAQIPSRFAIEMCNRGWILRNKIVWHKPNCMPCSVKDRFTVDFEEIFFFVKSKKYYFETQYEPIKEVSINRAKYKWNCDRANNKQGINTEQMGERFVNLKGRNMRTTWSICPQPYKEAHFATYPETLCETPIKSGCPISGTVLDPFFGAGTTGLVALKQNKKFIGIELNPKYIEIANNRLKPYLEQTKLT